MVESLEAVGHTVRVAEFWKDVHAALRGLRSGRVGSCSTGARAWKARLAAMRAFAVISTTGLTYTGNAPPPCACRSRKAAPRRCWSAGISHPAGREFKSASELATWEHFPSIVKPVSQHCSVGVTRDAVVHDVESLRQRIAYVNETIKEAALVEQFIAGREINVGVWGNGRPRVLPLREIDFSRIETPCTNW